MEIIKMKLLDDSDSSDLLANTAASTSSGATDHAQASTSAGSADKSVKKHRTFYGRVFSFFFNFFFKKKKQRPNNSKAIGLHNSKQQSTAKGDKKMTKIKTKNRKISRKALEATSSIFVFTNNCESSKHYKVGFQGLFLHSLLSKPFVGRSCPLCQKPFAEMDVLRYLRCLDVFHNECIEKHLLVEENEIGESGGGDEMSNLLKKNKDKKNKKVEKLVCPECGRKDTIYVTF